MNTQMIKFNLDDVLTRTGVSKYRLAKDTNIAYTTLWKLETGRAQRVGFDVLEKICLRLECTPGDLLSVVPDPPKKTTKKGGAGR